MKIYYKKPLLCSLWCSICTLFWQRVSTRQQQQVCTMYHSECVRGDGRTYCQTAVGLLSDFEGARLPS